ncbi:2OG-Fe(II) oxygenase [bacterium]|nr:2OG-Fe(II) oxygenase [bacterium]
MGSLSRVKRVKDFSELDIEMLVTGECVALIVEGYYSAVDSDRLAANVLKSKRVENYTHEVSDEGRLEEKYFGVDRLGVPFNGLYKAKAGDGKREHYYQQAKQSIQYLRGLASPALTPIDRLRLELDERMSFGATVASFEGQKMLAGIVRITRSDLSYLSAEQPHFDALPEQFARLDAQLAANVYLKVPDKGGELELWDVPPLGPLTTVPADWRSELPPSLRIKPLKGDMVLFNCRRPHAICEFEGEDRITAQMFMGYCSGQPLQMWN